MIYRFLFDLKCKFDYSYEYTYWKKLEDIRTRLFGDFSYPWGQFIDDVSKISEYYNLPERYVYQDLRDMMPDA